jgi:FtsP/CotA-like multicopper oxidase with cupredoxin domain
MTEPLFIIDLLLAAAAAAGAVFLGLRAAAGTRTRWPLIVTATLVAARGVVAVLLWTDSWYLVSDRITVGLPAAVLPLAAAVVLRRRVAVPARVAGQVAAVGVLISAFLAWVPQDPAARATVAAVVICVLAATGATASALLRWRRREQRAARLPWLSGLTLLVLATVIVGLYTQNQASASATGHGDHGIPVASLTGPQQGTPAARFTLVAAHGTVRLASGRQIDALTFNGTSPGPALRVRQGRLVEITLVNKDVAEGVTLHWHGVDVPNAEDGVPGLTQDPVLPGGRFVYRFVPERAGTFWYHTHRDSRDTVARGLFGAFLVDPPTTTVGDAYESSLFTHQWPTGKEVTGALDTADIPSRTPVQPGRPVRLRLINSSQDPQRVQVTGTAFRVTAIDGNAVHDPGPLPDGAVMLLAAGGRYDVAFAMPASAVAVSMHTTEQTGTPARVLVPADNPGTAVPHYTGQGELFDPAHYGTPDGTPPPGHADRSFDIVLENGFGFSNGTFTWANTVNGRLAPAIPTLTVSLGDTVRMRITNRGIIDHPMHLHGHRVRVLTRNGTPVTGSPWWTDTVNVAPGESYTIAFAADNPGIWMDHCHNFEHADNGMTWHLAYTGIADPGHSAHASE